MSQEPDVQSYAPRIRVEAVREGPSNIPKQKVQTPETAAQVMRLHLGNVADEHLVAVLLDAQNMLIGALTVASGTVDSCPASVKNVLRACVITNAVGVIVGHNHCSGRAKPSGEDVTFFKRLKRSCDDAEMRLLDCIIIGDGTEELYSHRRNTFDL